MGLKFLLALLLAFPFAAKSKALFPAIEDSGYSSQHNHRLELNVGLYLPGVTGDGWEPQYAFRTAYGREISTNLIVFANLQYYLFNIEQQATEFTDLQPRNAKRHDVAIYASLVAFRIFDLGLGGYYTTSDRVLAIGQYGTGGVWGSTGRSTMRFFLSVGIQYEFHIAHELYMPVGLFYRNTKYGTDGSSQPLSLKIGLGLKF
jgi:hypothetical protein